MWDSTGRHSLEASEEPRSKLTDKEMLIFNPNYKSLLDKLKQKENLTSQLGRILKEPSGIPTKKKELALFYFVR